MSVKKFNDSTESNRPTPETDLETNYCDAMPDMPWVDAEVARKLERERNEAREALAAIKHYLTKERDDALAQIVQAECRAERFCQERDEAREALENHMAATIHTCHDECKRPMCVLRRERDEAREAFIEALRRPRYRKTRAFARARKLTGNN